jgi:hypothetical protein
VDRLPAAIRGQLAATNLGAVVRGDWLYLVGGYDRPDLGKGPPATLDQVTAVRLSALVRAVRDPKALLDEDFAKAHMATAKPGTNDFGRLAVAGGALERVGDRFLLIFGHRYDGEYDPAGSVAQQEYSESVRAFHFDLADREQPALTVRYLGQEPPTEPLGRDPDNSYHRRDLTVGPALAPDGSEQIVAYGGVFKGGRIEGYLSPMIITPSDHGAAGLSVVEETGTRQLLSQYECASIPLFDARSGVMYTTFFGGISQYWWDDARGALVQDQPDLTKGNDGVPFINSVSTLLLRRTFDVDVLACARCQDRLGAAQRGGDWTRSPQEAGATPMRGNPADLRNSRAFGGPPSLSSALPPAPSPLEIPLGTAYRRAVVVLWFICCPPI